MSEHVKFVLCEVRSKVVHELTCLTSLTKLKSS